MRRDTRERYYSNVKHYVDNIPDEYLYQIEIHVESPMEIHQDPQYLRFSTDEIRFVMDNLQPGETHSVFFTRMEQLHPTNELEVR